VQFVVIDLDQTCSPSERDLVKKFYRGSMAYGVVPDRNGTPVYKASGEAEERPISKILDRALDSGDERRPFLAGGCRSTIRAAL
jgi:hypothetical protein